MATKKSNGYPFDILAAEDRPEQWWKQRPAAAALTQEQEAQCFVPTPGLEPAINAAVALGQPLLLTGAPGTGKTQSAYYAASRLGLGKVLHFSVKSDSRAQDLLYEFDAVGYFRAGQAEQGSEASKSDYVQKRELWEALAADQPRVLLIDEIDKAPRDFPNDLLHELDQMEFTIRETNETISAPKQHTRPIIIITSNSERRLPEPFLRRCLFHAIAFDDSTLEKALMRRQEQGLFGELDAGIVAVALARFRELLTLSLNKPPSTGELIVWLTLLGAAGNIDENHLKDIDISQLPYSLALLKDSEDQQRFLP